ncbi:unnamed protein product [Mytilus edulis]|uniref:Uncharacterized protein n=1 Tax=Mytilus edulis TaxID=6550 RepID=A0A8S3VKD7_MYTED|nr:unnamed protein product [Mytilus edulis]
MTGRKPGVQQRIKEIEPKALNNHCHGLFNLADNIKKNESLSNAVNAAYEITRLSSVRYTIKKDILELFGSPKKLLSPLPPTPKKRKLNASTEKKDSCHLTLTDKKAAEEGKKWTHKIPNGSKQLLKLINKAEPLRKEKTYETKVREEVETVLVINSDDDDVKMKQEPEEVKLKAESCICVSDSESHVSFTDQRLKKDSSYKRRVSWIGGQTNSIAIVEYIGIFPGLSAHGNTKKDTEYLRTPATVMTEMSDLLQKETPLNVYNILTLKHDELSGPTSRRQVHDKKYRDKKNQ